MPTRTFSYFNHTESPQDTESGSQPCPTCSPATVTVRSVFGSQMRMRLEEEEGFIYCHVCC